MLLSFAYCVNSARWVRSGGRCRAIGLPTNRKKKMLKKFKTYNRAVDFYKVGKNIQWPRHQKDQWLRASASIVLNLAEGSAKPTKKDQKKYYYIALGSLRECLAIIELEEVNNRQLSEIGDELGALLFKLTRF